MADFDPSYLTSVKFSTYSYEKVNKLCVKKITNFSTLDDVGIPVPNGLSDPAMGSFDADEICTTCSLNGYECPGHFGMIDLALPVYNPMFFASLVSLLKGSCFICHKPYAKSVLIQKFILQIKLIDSDLISASRELDSNYSKWNSMVSGQRIPPSEQNQFLESKMDKFYARQIRNAFKDKNSCKNITRVLSDERQNLIKHFIRSVYLDSTNKTCTNCKMPRASLKHEFCTMICVKILNTKNVNFQNIDPQLTQHATIKLDAESLSSPQHLTAIDVMHHFNQFSNHENKFLSTLYGHSDSKLLVHMFFLESVCVIPPKFRPVSFMGDSKFENATTGTYKKIIMNKILLENTLSELSNDSTSVSSFKYKGFRKRDLQGAFSRGSSKYERLQSVWSGLQTSINVLFDSKLSRNPKEDSIGLRQLLEKKEGLFRMNMMGKRVNQAARSVISPDPMLDVDEVGVPLVFATKLTYPEYLTSYNSQNMMTYVSNGPNLHPGASHVEFGRSKAILNATNSQRNYAICKRILSQDSVENTKIRRHLLNGDVVLMNRQPTLHRPSIMGHRVRILPKGRTIRLHYANCKSYNADFDGDEMNAHFPQNEIGRSEGYNISSCANHFLSPKDGKPLTGLIQDYMVSGFMMTVRDRFITKQQYQKIIYSSLVETDHLILCLPPAIQKPELLWTGKQIISTLLINCTPHLKDFLNMQGKCKVVEKLWSNCNSCTDVNLSEDNILIRNGELLMGVFDKNQFGASPYGLIHIFYEIYGGHCANKLLSVLGRACIALLQYTGFSMGVHDVVCQPESNVTRENLILESRNSDNKLLQAVFGAENDTELLKDAYRTAHATRQDNILIDLDCQAKNISNDFQNRINQACSSSHLLKTFPSNALQLMIQTGSKGTLVNAMQISGLLGQMELEGRRPPLMISGRTLPCYEPYCSSLQSGGFVESSFLSALKPSEYFFHCMAGREGLIDTAVKTSRSGYLQRCLVKHVEGVKVYYDYSARDSDGSIIQFLYGEDGCDVGSLQFAQDNKFEIFAMNKARLEAFVKPEEALKYIEKDRAPEYQEKVDLDKISFKTGKNNLLPTISLFNPGHYLGSVSENFLAQLLHYTKNDSGNTVVDGKYSSLNWQCNVKTFIKFMLLKYIRCLCPPGEAVGVLSAQSVGEPSTQMTLNTFHFAGRGDVNVTLGIPRLREIFLVGGENIKTPSISIDVLPTDSAFLAAKKLATKMTPIPLSKLISSISIKSEYDIFYGDKIFKQRFVITLNFLPKYLLKPFNIKAKNLATFIQHTFMQKLVHEITKKTNLRSEKLEVKRDAELMEKTTKSDDDSEDESNEKKAQSSTCVLSSDSDDSFSEEEIDKELEKEDSFDDNSDDNKIDNTKAADQIFPKTMSNSKGFMFDKHESCCKFEFSIDLTPQRTALMPIIKKLVEKTIVNQTNTKNCFVTTNASGSKLHVEGNNIYDFWKYNDIVSLKTLYSNNIYKMCEYYGVEAARTVLVKEIQNVFGVYGIAVNNRHLSLLADYMTFHGAYRPCNRYGINSNPSSFQKMSFETTIQFLKNACTYGDFESLKSPSARLVTGLPINIGTGSFEILTK